MAKTHDLCFKCFFWLRINRKTHFNRNVSLRSKSCKLQEVNFQSLESSEVFVPEPMIGYQSQIIIAGPDLLTGQIVRIINLN